MNNGLNDEEGKNVTGIRVAHAIPGRFRLQIPALKGNPILGREVAELPPMRFL